MRIAYGSSVVMVIARLVPVVLVAALASGCVDAPITPDQLESNGALRTMSLDQSAFSAQDRVKPQRAAQISAVLAAEVEGPLNDSNRFPVDVGQINLHLRADGLENSRPVLFRWTHRGDAAVVDGTLPPGDTLALATSFPIDPERTGSWTVEILGAPTHPAGEPVVLFERQFDIFIPSP